MTYSELHKDDAIKTRSSSNLRGRCEFSGTCSVRGRAAEAHRLLTMNTVTRATSTAHTPMQAEAMMAALLEDTVPCVWLMICAPPAVPTTSHHSAGTELDRSRRGAGTWVHRKPPIRPAGAVAVPLEAHSASWTAFQTCCCTVLS